jgi:hypothetical protein
MKERSGNSWEKISRREKSVKYVTGTGEKGRLWDGVHQILLHGRLKWEARRRSDRL